VLGTRVLDLVRHPKVEPLWAEIVSASPPLLRTLQ